MWTWGGQSWQVCELLESGFLGNKVRVKWDGAIKMCPRKECKPWGDIHFLPNSEVLYRVKVTEATILSAHPVLSKVEVLSQTFEIPTTHIGEVKGGIATFV